MYEIRPISDLTNAAIMGLSECFSPVIRDFKRGEIITIFSPEDDTIGIILSGKAYISTNNFNDQRRILDYIGTGECFGRCFLPDNDNNLYYVQAKTVCKIGFVRRSKLLACCDNNCSKHIALINHLLTGNTKRLLIHTDVLSQQSLKNKLLAYFEHLSVQNRSESFTLPLPLSDLSDYLSVDRSAMMRELKKLNDDGIISSKKRNIRIIKNQYNE